jgi:hypothetical protein
MKFEEALQAIDQGKRVTCSAIPLGAVVKAVKEGWNPSKVRVVFEATGAGFDFTARDEHRAADWSIVEGWV